VQRPISTYEVDNQ